MPGTGGNTQIGSGSGTNSHATTNNDLHVTGALEVNGGLYADSGITAGNQYGKWPLFCKTVSMSLYIASMASTDQG